MTELRTNSQRTKRMILWLKIISLGGISILITYFLFNSYYQRLELSKKVEFQKLEATVNALAISVDGDAHQKLMKRYRLPDQINKNEDDSIYAVINSQLKSIAVANQIPTDIYTLIKYDGDTPSPDHATCFGVTSSSPYFRHPYQPPNEMLEIFDVGGKIGPYGDDHGTWLSAIAPIKNNRNEVVAVVQADIQFDTFIAEANEAFKKELIVSIFVFILVVGFVWIFISRISSGLIEMQNIMDLSFSKLNTVYTSVTNFAREIERGNLETELELEDQDDNILVSSLNNMRTSLLNVRNEEETKRWVAEGVEVISKFIGDDEVNLNKHGSKILSALARYLNVPIGVLYILDYKGDEHQLTSIADIGLGNHFKEQSFQKNEGLVGRIFQEKEPILLTNIPRSYHQVNSGSGKHEASTILIYPLKINNNIEGALELVSFKTFEPICFELLEKIAGPLTSTLFQRKTNIRTLDLLETSRKLNEETEQANAQLNVMRDEAIKSKEEAILLKNLAEKASSVKSEFLANMSHELRTPLNGVIGYAQILLEDEDVSDKHRAQIQIINTSGNHLLGLINNVLDLSKIEAGRQELNSSEFDLDAWANDIIKMMSLRAQQKNLSLQLNLDSRLPQFITSDSEKLRQCVINLIINSLKFTEEGGVVFDIRREEDEKIGFYIIDSGKGIPEDKIDVILEPFGQIHDNGVNEGGTGLGLTITRDFVRLLGGQLAIESQVNKGSTFKFKIPLQEVQFIKGYHADTSKRIVGFNSDKDIKILIVDDILVNRGVAREILLKVGFNCVEAENGQEGLEVIQTEKPDLILSDIRMPIMDGFEMMEEVRKDPKINKIPIVAMTASAENVFRSEILAQGFDDFIAKPFRMIELLEMVATHLEIEYTYEEAEVKEKDKIVTAKEIDLKSIGALISDDSIEAADEALLAGDLQELEKIMLSISGEIEGIDKLKKYVSSHVIDFDFEGLELIINQLKKG